MHSAKEEVSDLIRKLGFSPIDRGALRNAREIEDIPVQRFPLWKKPLIISTVLFAVLFLLSFSKWVTLFFCYSPVIYLVWCFIESQTTFTIGILSNIYGSHLLFSTRKDYVCKYLSMTYFVEHKYLRTYVCVNKLSVDEMSSGNPHTRNSYWRKADGSKILHHFLSDFWYVSEMSFAVILLCTIQRQKTKELCLRRPGV